ncbi:MAG: hypothetical protein J7501_09065 [Bdellovibrio sp.]|nr:hypothetical protein [Bdellovibrio sp.]
MKLMAAVFVLLASVASQAAVTQCVGADERAQLTLQQVDGNVAIRMETTARNYNKYHSGNDKLPKLDVDFFEGQAYLVKNTDIETLKKDRQSLERLVVIGLFSIRLFDGEEDMQFVNAQRYISLLKCE